MYVRNRISTIALYISTVKKKSRQSAEEKKTNNWKPMRRPEDNFSKKQNCESVT